MLKFEFRSWFYPPPTGDTGRDRNARSVQLACFLLGSAVSTVAILDVISREPGETPLLVFAVLGLVAGMIMNRAGMWEWAARTAFLALLLTAMLLVFEARDGFRSLAMLMFPGMLLVSVMLLDRASYMIAAGIVLVAVAALGIAERQGLTRAIPGVRSSTTYESIFFVDLNLLVFALIGSRIARDAQSNVLDLRATIDQLSEANQELRETAEALRESEQQQISIYNTVQDVIFHLAVEPEDRFRFVSVNAAFLKVTGLSWEAVVGKTVNQVIPEPSLAIVLRKYRQAIEEKTTVLWEETSNYPTGRLTGEVSVVPVFDDQGACTHLVGSVHDVTELRRAEEEAFARQKLETLGTLANGIAHDFNNILGAVLAQAEVALTGLDSDSVPTGELRAIRDAAMRGAEIVRELLIYAGSESPVLVPLDISQVVGEMFGLLKVSVSKHARIEIDLAKDLPAVRANPAQISQLLMNLVTNASDAIGDQTGTIRVIARRVAAGSGVSRSWTERDYVQLEVSDTGCGMKPETQAKVFEPFFSTKSMGRGIGLAIVDGIVRSLGGAIRLESEPGQGTIIGISLPAAETDSKAIDSAEPAIVEDTRQSRVTTVLIVEDEAHLRQAVSKMLGKTGLVVIEAADGETALDAIRTRHPIDVMVLDITIPGASSREVFEEALRLRAEMRVIVTSAYSENVATVSLRGPVRHFLRKPYRLTDLAGLIQTVA
jgi:PAS domain S-box-containing protein